MKKRLISFHVKQATLNGSLEHKDNDSNMMSLKALDSSDVKTDTCPQCKYSPLSECNGFKVCMNCGAKYKIYNDEVYCL